MVKLIVSRSRFGDTGKGRLSSEERNCRLVVVLVSQGEVRLHHSWQQLCAGAQRLCAAAVYFLMLHDGDSFAASLCGI